jgi:hypothetical protein
LARAKKDLRLQDLFLSRRKTDLSVAEAYPRTMSVADERGGCRYLAKEVIIIVPTGKSKSKHAEDRKEAPKESRANESNPNFISNPVPFRKKITYLCAKGKSVAHAGKCPFARDRRSIRA